MINRKYYKWVELTFWFILLPVFYLLDEFPFHKIISLLCFFLYCITLLSYQRTWRKSDWRWKENYALLLTRFGVISGLVFMLLWITTPEMLIIDFSDRPFLPRMIILYPFLSALPQELIYRKFFYHRYGDLINNEKVVRWLNIVLFSLAHLYFLNWIVLLGTLIGGYLFNVTYHKTKSLIPVSIEHSLYGLMLLSSGFSDYFNKPF